MKYKTPDNLLYSRTHEWVKLTKNGLVVVGITDYLQNRLHKIEYLELPKEGKMVKAGEALAIVEALKTSSEIYSPISGRVIEVNKELEKNPRRIHEDPYGDGWIVKVKPINWESEAKALLNHEEYRSMLSASDS